jgi:hypothetical protein
MSGELVPFKKPAKQKGSGAKAETQSAEQIAAGETKLKAAILAWAADLAGKVYRAVLNEIALQCNDKVDDEESSDLVGEYDPCVDPRTGQHLFDAIAEYAAELKRPKEMLNRLYQSALKKLWDEHKKQKRKTSDPVGDQYGMYLTNNHGVWCKLSVGGLPDFFVWRRICRTQINPLALSYDTNRRNWRRHYLITNETGQIEAQIGNEKLAREANPAINTLMRCGVHPVETTEARQHLAKFLRFKPRARRIRAPQTGWFKANTGWVFVLPDQVLGNETLGARDAKIVLDSTDAGRRLAIPGVGARSARRGANRAGRGGGFRGRRALIASDASVLRISLLT